MKLENFQNKKVLIWGLGQEGRAFIESVCPQVDAEWFAYSDAAFSDIDRAFLSDYPRIQPVLVGELARRLKEVTVIVKSPGVSLYKAEIQSALARGVSVTSGTNIWFAENPAVQKIVVTASKGKSTTSALLAHILMSLGHSVALAGNIGVPLISCLDHEPVDYWVIEMSSYQLADFNGEVPYGILLNLFSDHLDWHQGQHQYEADKLNLVSQLASGGTLVTSESIKMKLPETTTQQVLVYNDSTSSIQLYEQGVVYKEQQYPLRHELFPGSHTRLNLSAALCLLESMGFSIVECIATLSSFQPLPHRLATVASKGGILFIDDSISTIPESSVAAVKALSPRPCILILGGFDRGVAWDEAALELSTCSIKSIICTGQNGRNIKSALPGSINASYEPDFERAVRLAICQAEGNDVVLLSPGAPSFDQFSNFKERGLRFLELVHNALPDTDR